MGFDRRHPRRLGREHRCHKSVGHAASPDSPRPLVSETMANPDHDHAHYRPVPTLLVIAAPLVGNELRIGQNGRLSLDEGGSALRRHAVWAVLAAVVAKALADAESDY